MADETVFRVGEVRRLTGTLRDDTEFAVQAVTCTVRTVAGLTVVNAQAGFWDVGLATSHEVYYLWDLAAVEPGDYVYGLACAVGDETRVLAGEVTVLPAVGTSNLLDRYVRRVADWLLDTGAGEEARLLGPQQYRRALQAALQVYQVDRPREVSALVDLTTDQFEYDLPTTVSAPGAPWVTNLSTLLALEYPVDATEQSRTWLTGDEWEIDEVLGKWRFLATVPTTGEQARLYYTCAHELSASVDTIPARHFEALTQYAAGVALMSLGNRAAGRTAPVIGADSTNYRTQQQEYRSQAERMMAQARASWGRRSAAGTAQLHYLEDHGLVAYAD